MSGFLSTLVFWTCAVFSLFAYTKTKDQYRKNPTCSQHVYGPYRDFQMIIAKEFKSENYDSTCYFGDDDDHHHHTWRRWLPKVKKVIIWNGLNISGLISCLFNSSFTFSIKEFTIVVINDPLYFSLLDFVIFLQINSSDGTLNLRYFVKDFFNVFGSS